MRQGLAVAVLLIASSLPTKIVAQFTCTAAGSPGDCSIPGQVVFTATGVISLQMSSASTALSAPTAADFKAGFNTTLGPTLTIRSNQPWTLHLRAVAPLWTATSSPGHAPARATKPASDLNWGTAVNGTFIPLTTSDVTVVNGAASDGTTATLFFRTVYSWNLDTPGNYSLAMLITLTAP